MGLLMRHKILIIDDMHPSLMLGLEENKIQFTYEPKLSKAEVLELLPDYTGLVVRSKLFIDRTILDAGTKLLFVARAGSGMDNIDLEATNERGIACINAPEANRDAVSEHALAMLLNLTRNISKSSKEVNEFIWDREGNRGDELGEMTVGIIGYGNTGSSLAKKLSGFGCEVIFYDKYLKNVPTPYAKEALLSQVLKQADVLSFHIPLDKNNKHFIDKQLLSQLEKPVYLLNLSRGGIMNTQDILWGLEKGIIKAAALDVLENEKVNQLNAEELSWFNKLRSNQRVLLTPHIAGWTYSSYRKISEVLLSKIMTLLREDKI